MGNAPHPARLERAHPDKQGELERLVRARARLCGEMAMLRARMGRDDFQVLASDLVKEAHRTRLALLERDAVLVDDSIADRLRLP